MEQEEYFASFSILDRFLQLNIPPLDASRLGQWRDTSYLQCMNVKLSVDDYDENNCPLTTFNRQGFFKTEKRSQYGDNEHVGPNSKRTRKGRAADTEKYSMHLKSYLADASESARIMNLEFPKTKLTIAQYIKQINEASMTKSASFFNRPAMFIDWAPIEALDDGIFANISDWVKQDFNLYGVDPADAYDPLLIPPKANVYQLSDATNLGIVKLIVFVSRECKMLWHIPTGPERLGFISSTTQDPNVVSLKLSPEAPDKKKVFMIDNLDGEGYVELTALTPPTVPFITALTSTSIMLDAGFTRDIEVDMIVDPTKKYYNAEELVDAVFKEPVNKLAEKCNLRFKVYTETEAPFQLQFKFPKKKRLTMTVEWEPTLTNIINLQQSNISKLYPFVICGFFS